MLRTVGERTCHLPKRCGLTARTLLAIVLISVGLMIGPASRAFGASTVRPVVNSSQPQQAITIRAVVGSGGTSLLDSPGGNAVQELQVGENLTAIGRTVDGNWTAVRLRDETTGWVLTDDVLMFGGSQLPILAGGANLEAGPASGNSVSLPTPTYTPEATPTPVFTSTPTPTPPVLAASGQSAGNTSAPAVDLTGGQVAVVRSGGTQLRGVPNGSVLQALATGTAVTVNARTEDSEWLAAITSSGSRGWLPAADVVSFSITRLPAVASVPLGDAPSEGFGQSAPSEPDGDASVSVEDSDDAVVVASPLQNSQVTATVAITDSRLNVRSGPGVAYQVLAKALPGERYSAIGRDEDAAWIQIAGGQLDGGTGWVSADYVTLTAPRATLPIGDVTSSNASILPTAPPSSARLSQAQDVQSTNQPRLTGNLVVQGSGGGIYLVNLETGASRLLVSGIDPAISPDGATVAFTRGGGDNGIFLIGIDGSNERRIYSGGEGLRSPSWSPDGSYIVFSRLEGEYECRDVGFGICLPDNPFLDGFDLTTRPENGLSRVNTNGGEFEDLPTLTSAKAPSWGTGGVTYQSNSGIEITSDEPNASTRLVLNAPYYQDPDWQPGTDRIAFQSREGSHWEIFSVAQDGNGLFALTKPVTTLVDQLPSNVAPAWSPDGQHVVYLSNRDERNNAGDWGLWVMNADGSGQRPLGIDLPLDYSYAAEQIVDWGIDPGG